MGKDADARPGPRDEFTKYLKYRFIEWFTTSKTAPAILLLVMTLMLVVTGAIAYSIIVGGTPTQAMYKIFIFTTAASADRETTVAGRFLAILVTVCGLIILSLLLGIVAEWFTTNMERARQGRHEVHEASHTVLLGYSTASKFLIEELARASESEGGRVIVVLAALPKVEVEEQLESLNVDTRNSKLIVRSGSPCSFSALKAVAVDRAKTVVVTASSGGKVHDEVHEEIVCTLLALKSAGWPLHPKSKIIVQCATDANRSVLKAIYPSKVEVVVIGEIIAKFMVQSAFQPYLMDAFSSMLGFEGSELYVKEWPELVGRTFRDAYFRIPNAVVMGVFMKDQSPRGYDCELNPSAEYRIRKGDKLIVLAEDDDKYCVEKKPYFPYRTYETKGLGCTLHTFAKMEKDANVLIIGWNKLIGGLLAALDSRADQGCSMKVTVYSEHPAEERVDEIGKFKGRFGHKMDNIIIQHVAVPFKDLTAHDNLMSLEHWKCSSIFVLADADRPGGPDKMNVAIMAHLQAIGRAHPDQKKRFNPVIEMHTQNTKEYLKTIGLKNLVHSSSLVSKALASVAYQPEINEICTDLTSMRDNEFNILSLAEFLPPDRDLPTSISFGEAAFYVNSAKHAILVGWSPHEPTEDDCDWVLNPPDKDNPRPWTPADRVVVLIRLDRTGSTPRTARSPQVNLYSINSPV
jgi:Trk K+ transport system NAD-binding subunit